VKVKKQNGQDVRMSSCGIVTVAINSVFIVLSYKL